MCTKVPWKSIVCIQLNALQRATSRNLFYATGKYDLDCYQMYKRSEMMNALMDTCTQNQEYRNDSLFATDCLFIQEWTSVLAVYSTNCEPKQNWSNLSNSNDRYTYQKSAFVSESSLSLAKQENQTWNQTISSWYQIEQQIIRHRSNHMGSNSYPTNKPKKCDFCTLC